MKIEIKPLYIFEKSLDILFLPIMYAIAWISGGFGESPQMTHHWNNYKFSGKNLNLKLADRANGVVGKVKRQGYILKNVLFHVPFLSGPRSYAVVSPADPSKGWHAGWHNEHVTGVSRIRCYGPVRLLVGSDPINFLGFDSEGNQIPVKIIGYGKIGDAGPFRKLPLL